MSSPQPINESEADAHIAHLYADIKHTLDISFVPTLFRYVANYPLLFERLWGTLRLNFQDESFVRLQKTIQQDVLQTADTIIDASPTMHAIINKLIPSEKRLLIAQDIGTYFKTQLQLAFICIAIRERTKGWDIGAKYLPDAVATGSRGGTGTAQQIHTELHELVVTEAATSLTVRDDVREYLLKYILYMHEEFVNIVTQDVYVFTRVQFEKSLIHHIPHIPHPIFASYNEVAKSVPDKRELGFVFYLLAEKFPVGQTVAALLWSVSLRALEQV